MSYPNPSNSNVNWKRLFIAWMLVVAVLAALSSVVKMLESPQAQAQAQIQVARVSAPIDQTTTHTYAERLWTYKHFQATRSSGQQGILLYADKDLSLKQPRMQPRPRINDYYETPWDYLYWHGSPSIRWLPHGWMPFPTWREGPGLQLPDPERWKID